MKTLSIIIAVLALSGCASLTTPDGQKQSAGPGQAVYTYEKTPGGSCKIQITSAREVPGLKANVDKNCAVEITADKLSGEALQLKMFDVLESLLPTI